MVEYWNVGLNKEVIYINFIDFPVIRNVTCNPFFHFTLRAGGQSPLFHHSIVPSFQLRSKAELSSTPALSKHLVIDPINRRKDPG